MYNQELSDIIVHGGVLHERYIAHSVENSEVEPIKT